MERATPMTVHPPWRESRDRELMDRAAKGDSTAYGELFERHAAKIWRMAHLLLHSAASADDVVQDTFVRGLEHLESYRGESEPGAWFYAIGLNVCRHIVRDRQCHEENADLSLLERARPFGRRARGVMTSVLHRERQRRLAVALGFLTEAQREVFVLHYIQGLPYDQVGRLTGVTAGAARVQAHRAKTLLRARLGSDFSAGPAETLPPEALPA